MTGKIKLGLTRNRLFDFCNCVCFTGNTEKEFDETELNKAMKMLSVKNPVVCSAVELDENDGNAYVTFGKVTPIVNFIECDVKEFTKNKVEKGVEFWKQLFEFYVVNKTSLCIFAHTAVADKVSVSVLASQLMAYYNKETISVNEEPFEVFSELSSIPLTALSPVTQKLSTELELKWISKPVVFSVSDYTKAREEYCKKNGSESCVTEVILPELLGSLKSFAKEKNVDVSTVVAVAYYESLCSKLSVKKKNKKFYFQTDRRCILENSCQYLQGAHNGLLQIFFSDKEAKLSPEKKIVAFHKKVYKGFCSAYSNFVNDLFLMNLSPSFCDSAFMSLSGIYKNKVSEKLANNHSCCAVTVGEFTYNNFSQQFFSGLKCFGEVSSTEPLKNRSMTLLHLDLKENSAKLILKYRENTVPTQLAQEIVSDLIAFLYRIK